jgi:hypothetical protein
MIAVILFAYLGLCFCLALIGTNRKFGYWGYFFCSLFLTPLIGSIVLLGSDKRPKIPKKCPKCSSLLVART